jgi:hypothetical protein
MRKHWATTKMPSSYEVSGHWLDRLEIGEGVTLSNIGLMYDDLGQYEAALGFYKMLS